MEKIIVYLKMVLIIFCNDFNFCLMNSFCLEEQIYLPFKRRDTIPRKEASKDHMINFLLFILYAPLGYGIFSCTYRFFPP